MPGISTAGLQSIGGSLVGLAVRGQGSANPFWVAAAAGVRRPAGTGGLRAGQPHCGLPYPGRLSASGPKGPYPRPSSRQHGCAGPGPARRELAPWSARVRRLVGRARLACAAMAAAGWAAAWAAWPAPMLAARPLQASAVVTMRSLPRCSRGFIDLVLSGLLLWRIRVVRAADMFWVLRAAGRLGPEHRVGAAWAAGRIGPVRGLGLRRWRRVSAHHPGCAVWPGAGIGESPRREDHAAVGGRDERQPASPGA
jgi:hypothetical protein